MSRTRRRVIVVCTLAATLFASHAAGAATTGGTGGQLVDRTNLTFTNATGVTSRYHLYAAGLDWSRPVGLLVYADGSAEYGLEHPSSTYLLAGRHGMVAVARRANMVLLTPLAPGAGCPDGDGRCWYQTSSDITPGAKARWSFDLVRSIQRRYPIETDRVAFGGYSSGAQWTTEFFGPAWASRVMTDGVAVAISYGGAPIAAQRFSHAHRKKVPYVWDTGDRDPAWTTRARYGVRAGHAWYRDNGFAANVRVVRGLGHARRDFGRVMERAIRRHVPTATSSPVPAPHFMTQVRAASTAATLAVHVPAGTEATTYVRLSGSDGVLRRRSSRADGAGVPFRFARLASGDRYAWEVWSDGKLRAAGSFRTR